MGVFKTPMEKEDRTAVSVLNKDEFFDRLHARIGDDTSEEGIAFLEDMTDTYNDLQNKANGDGVDWEKRYHDLDESWKKRYQHRFLSGVSGVPDNSQNTGTDEPNPDDITVADLFNKEDK